MSSTRCKFRCGTVIDNGYGGKTVNLNAMWAPNDPDSENGKFWTATPNGLIQLQINNPDGAAIFETGADYYVDFIPAA